MQALFIRKVIDMAELKFKIHEAHRYDEAKYTEYAVTLEIKMSGDAFREFTNNFLEDQDWIEGFKSGTDEEGRQKVIRVRGKHARYNILVDPQGYDYPRYVAIEPKGERL